MGMNNGQLNWIAGFIWNIADDVLRDVYVRGKYRDVILPMTVIRRLDAVLESTKEAVLKLNKQLDDAGVANKDAALCQASGNAFYNVSPFTLRDLRARAKQHQLKADFETYLDGFSPNVQEILDKFKFRNQIPTLVDADILGSVIEKFTGNDINLGPNPVYDQDGNVRLPGLDNHAMGTIFEELIRRFNEENNEEAGEHFTPRDVVKLMANLIFYPVADQIRDATYRVYDGACGTGGMLTVAEETLEQLAQEHGKEVSIHLFGQEVQPETYAISKADLLLKGEGQAAENSRAGNGNFPHTVGKSLCVYIEFGLAVFSGRKTRVRVYDDRNGGIFAKLLHYRKHFIRPQRAVNAERVNAESFKQSDHCRRVCAGH